MKGGRLGAALVAAVATIPLLASRPVLAQQPGKMQVGVKRSGLVRVLQEREVFRQRIEFLDVAALPDQ